MGGSGASGGVGGKAVSTFGSYSVHLTKENKYEIRDKLSGESSGPRYRSREGAESTAKRMHEADQKIFGK